jgi:rRNA maturation endonuclease Nob1
MNGNDVRFCQSCGTILSDEEKKYCMECAYNLMLDNADKFEGEYKQLEIPSNSYKYVGVNK